LHRQSEIIRETPLPLMGRKDGGKLNLLSMFNQIIKAVTFTTALLAFYNEVRRTVVFESVRKQEKCKPVKGFSA